MFDKIFRDTHKDKSFSSDSSSYIGETDKCPYCHKKLDGILSKKKKCNSCGKFIYVTTRPSDRKRVLVNEEQKNVIQEQWSKYHQEKEELKCMENSDFVKAKKDLTKQFGKEPSINDVKWKVFNQELLTHSMNKNWGLYRNTKLQMASLLKSEKKLKDALATYFEVCYLDINGCSNSGYFDPSLAFLAPGVISQVQDVLSEMKILENDSKKLFYLVNEKMKPMKNMPVSPEKAYKILFDELGTFKKIKTMDVNDYDLTYSEIKKYDGMSNFDKVDQIISRLRSKFYSGKSEIKNPEKLKNIVEELLKFNNPKVYNSAESLLFTLLKKDRKNFEDLAAYYAKYVRNNPQKFSESHVIGRLADFDIDLAKPHIPNLIKSLKEHKEWNTRRLAAFNIGTIGSKNPLLVKEAIPILVDYIKNPREITLRKPLKFQKDGASFEFDLSPEKMLGVDQKQWLKDAYIDTLGMIAKGDKKFIQPYKDLLRLIASKDKSPYSRKKAQKVLDCID